MVDETVNSYLEVSIHFPEIPEERIASVTPGWEVLDHTDKRTALRSLNQNKAIILTPETIHTKCISDQGKNKQNLKAIEKAILSVAGLSKKDEIITRIKKQTSTNTLYYPSLPSEVTDFSITEHLAIFRKNPKLEELKLKVKIENKKDTSEGETDKISYDFFSTNEGKFTTLTCYCPLPTLPKMYSQLVQVFKFLETGKSVERKKIPYIS